MKIGRCDGARSESESCRRIEGFAHPSRVRGLVSGHFPISMFGWSALFCQERAFVGKPQHCEVMEEEGEGGALRELRRGRGEECEGREGAGFEKASMRENGTLDGRDESNSELSIGSSTTQVDASESVDAKMMESGALVTPEKVEPEVVNISREGLVSVSNKGRLVKGSLRDGEAAPGDTPNRQESIDCPSFLESDDCSESAPADNVSEKSTSVKNYSSVEDEGATPQVDERKEVRGKESEDVVMEIAQRLSQLRSIGNTAESARKYSLESDTGVEDLVSNDHVPDLLGPKRLDFEVIDFDQFGAQPPDLPVNVNSMKVNLHHGSSNGGKRAGASTKTKEHEHHHVRVSNAHDGFEQEMKGLNDSPVKTSLKNSPERKQLQKERRGTCASDLHVGHVIPRLCNMLHAKEGSRAQEVSKDLDPNSIAGRSGNPKLRLLDPVKTKKIGEAPSGSPIRRSKSTMPDGKGSPVHEETRKRTEDLQQLSHVQAKRLEDCCKRVDSLTAQIQEQSRLHEELNRKHEAECGERLKSEAKSMVLCELLPNVEQKLKDLCDQMLFMEMQLQEQVDLRIKLEEALERERQERIHLVATIEEHVDARNKLEDGLELEHQARMHLAAILEEQVDLRDKFEDDLQQERQERMHLAAKLEEQIGLHEEVAYKLDLERGERLKSESDVIVLREILPNLETKLEDLNNHVQSLVGQLQEQTELREELKQKLDQEREERTHDILKLEHQTKIYEELSHKFEEEQSEAANVKHLHKALPEEEDKLIDVQNQLLSLTMQLQNQIELRKVLEARLDQEREERTQNALSLPVSSVPGSEKLEIAKLPEEQKKLLSNQVKEAEMVKTASENKADLLDHQVQNLEVVLSEVVETMEFAFSAKERAFRQTVWTIFQALCLAMGFVNFILSCRNTLQSSLQPT